MRKLSRREFIEAVAGVGAAIFVGGCGRSGGPVSAGGAVPHAPKLDLKGLGVASGNDPGRITRAAVDAIGGMKKLVKSGDTVVIKPNIAWNRPPDAAATTNPAVVAEIVKMCKEAGASKILVMDYPCDRPAEAVFGFCGVQDAAEKAGAVVTPAVNESQFRSVSIPKGKVLNSDTCIKDILAADVFINVPIAKAHSSTKLTLGMKNLMGCIWDRQNWHKSGLDQCIADYATAIRPDLTVLDANRVLLTNGPKGPGQTKDICKVVAGTDPVAVDAYGATLFGLKPEDIGYIRLAHELGVGEIDLTKVRIV